MVMAVKLAAIARDAVSVITRQALALASLDSMARDVSYKPRYSKQRGADGLAAAE
jgi:hypothetical protein